MKWLWYEQGTQEYKHNHWGQIFPGSSIDVYEWVESQSLPSEWNARIGSTDRLISGTALYGDDSQYTVTQKYDSRLDMMVNYYYFWVKGKVDMPKNSVVKRKNTVAYVANLIQNPGAFDFKYYAISDTNKFFEDVKSIYDDSGKDKAIEFCESTPGPVASIFLAGLSKMGKQKEEIEKAVQNAGGLEMAFLERNMIWINSVITIAPMLGFTGTVVGMIAAFDAIKAANDISPAVVAGGISQALLTTAFGLVVAMIIQVCQNYFSSQIDAMVLDMEEKSIELTDLLTSK